MLNFSRSCLVAWELYLTDEVDDWLQELVVS